MVCMKEGASIWCTISYYSSFYNNSVKASVLKVLASRHYLVALKNQKEVFMKFNKLLFPATLYLFAVLSCSNPVHVQKDLSVDLSNYHTYMWVDTKASDQDNSARPTAYVDMSVHNRV